MINQNPFASIAEQLALLNKNSIEIINNIKNNELYMDNNQYFITKIKDEYLPQVMKDNISNGKIQRYTYLSILYIDKKYLRKIKIKNIDKSLGEEEQTLLNFLLNDNFVDMLTIKQFEKKTKNVGFTTGSQNWGSTTGSSGTLGIYGLYGVTGQSST